MKKYFALPTVLIAIVCAFSFVAHAAPVEDEEPQEVSTPSKHPLSRDIRNGKSMSLTFQPIGYGPTARFEQAIHAGFFLSTDSLLQVELSYGGRNDLYRSRKVQNDALSFYFKHFVGNSFYFKAGGDYRMVDYKYDNSDYYYGSSEKFKGNAGVASFVIGNQWQLGPDFTIGCDWIGVSIPLFNSVSEEFSAASSASSIQNAREDEDLYLKNTLPQFLRFYLGASF